MKNTFVHPNVDSYLAALPDKEREVLTHLREVIKSAAPQAEEVISYQIPAYKYHGMLVYFAAYQKHCSLFAVNKESFAEDLADYKTSKGTIQFTVEKPLPDDLVRRIVAFRLRQNQEKAELEAQLKPKKKVK